MKLVLSPSYKNLANPTSADWLTDTRLATGYGYGKSNAGSIFTNYIPAKRGDVLRVKGLNLFGLVNSQNSAIGCYTSTDKTADSTGKYNSYDKLYTWTSIKSSASTEGAKDEISVDGDVFTYTILMRNGIQFGSTGVEYIRISAPLMAGYTANDVIITINEEITSNSISSLTIPEGEVAAIKKGSTIMWSLLPEEYQQVQYIESTGNQHIDTGILASDYPDGLGYLFEGVVLGPKNTGGSYWLWGALNSGKRSGNLNIANTSTSSGTTIGLAVGSTGGVKLLPHFEYDEYVRIEAFAKSSSPKASLLLLNGVEAPDYTTNVTATDMPEVNVHLLKLNGGSAALGDYIKVQLHRFKITDVNGRVLRNFIPCYRKADDTVGLYDTVGANFYVDPNGNKFLKGKDFEYRPYGELPKEYQRVSHIETDGNQYIDTGVKASDYPDGLEYVFKGNCTGVRASNNYLFGCLNNGQRSGNVAFNSGASVIYAFVGGSNSQYNYTYHLNSDFTIQARGTPRDAENFTVTYNGTSFYKGTIVNSEMPSANIYLLACNLNELASSSSSVPFTGKLYSFTMADMNGTLIRNFVPCYRKADGVIGLFDTIGRQFYINAGSGSFTKGTYAW